MGIQLGRIFYIFHLGFDTLVHVFRLFVYPQSSVRIGIRSVHIGVSGKNVMIAGETMGIFSRIRIHWLLWNSCVYL